MSKTHSSTMDKGSKNEKPKLPRLPENVKVQKRPLLHGPISSPHAGRQTAKIVYISSKTPFMSAMKRVKQLLKYVDKRTMQSVLSSNRSRGKASITSATPKDEKAEEVTIKATGKAIDKALNLALFFQTQQDCCVRINTGSVSAIDDLVQAAESKDQSQELKANETKGQTSKHTDEVSDTDLPEARIRHASMIEIFVSLRP